MQQNFLEIFSKLNFINSIRSGHKVGDPTVQDRRALKYKTEESIEFKLGHLEDFQILLRVRFKAATNIENNKLSKRDQF